jgi:type IV pilus assembly protein PilW
MTGRVVPRGLSLVELLVGIAVALVVVAASLKAFTGHVVHVRHMLLEARVEQDLRAATDIIVRDLRRAGYWQHASRDVATPNPYGDLVVEPPSEIAYTWSQDDEENNVVDSKEHHGFKLSDHVLRGIDGHGGWQPMTDPAVVQVTDLSFVTHERIEPLGQLCSPACAASNPACPNVVVREVEVQLAARATADPQVRRKAVERVRLRNDHLPVAACP